MCPMYGRCPPCQVSESYLLPRVGVLPYLGHMTIWTDAGVIPEFTMSDRLRKAREMTGLDQAEFAGELGVSRQTVSNYEMGNTTPRRLTLRAWSLRTGVPVVWLETGEVPPPGDGDGTSNDARPEGLEPPTFWLGASRRLALVDGIAA